MYDGMRYDDHAEGVFVAQCHGGGATLKNVTQSMQVHIHLHIEQPTSPEAIGRVRGFLRAFKRWRRGVALTEQQTDQICKAITGGIEYVRNQPNDMPVVQSLPDRAKFGDSDD